MADPTADVSASSTTDWPKTDSGIPIAPLYTAESLNGWESASKLGEPGKAPYTRGVYPTMYRGKLWTMRQYAGFGTAASTNERFKFLLQAGQTGLSCAFDLPTQMGYDSDHPRAEGEVGKVGVAIDSMADMRILLSGLPLDKVSTSMTINSTGAILLLMYELVAEEQGVPASAISGTIQNDLLKEYIARGTYIYPPRPSMRVITDIFEYCSKHVPKWNTISISGYHIREAGSTAVQEIAFTIANAIAYVQAAVDAGLKVDDFAPRLSFFWNGHNNFFEEVAKFRAAQPLNNVVRVAIQSMAAVLGGTQSLHTNGYDEAISLPTEEAARIALRTQQIIGYESGVADTPDPLAGSYFVEKLTDEVEALAWQYIERIDEMGGAVAAIEQGFQMDEIEQAAYEYTKSIDDDERVIVGVNKFKVDVEPEPKAFPIDPQLQVDQVASLKQFKANRDMALVKAKLDDVTAAARGTQNLLYPMKEALRANATLGEVSDALREVFGVYQP